MIESEMNEEIEESSKRPTHIAYWVKDREHKKGEWYPIGVVWTHADGKGCNIALDLQPRDGCITLRVLEEKTECIGILLLAHEVSQGR